MSSSSLSRWTSVCQTGVAIRKPRLRTRTANIRMMRAAPRRAGRSPSVVGRAIDRRLLFRSGFDVDDPRDLVEQGILGGGQLPDLDPRRGLASDRIDRDGPEVAVLDEGLEGGRVLALVLGVLVDEPAQDVEVLLEHGLAGLDGGR